MNNKNNTNNIKIMPTFLRIQITDKSHRLSTPKCSESKIELKLKSFFDFGLIAKDARSDIYSNILSGEQTGNVILPYVQTRPAGEWHYGKTCCNLGSMQTTDRILICEKAREITEAEIKKEELFAETDAGKKLLMIHRDQEAYDCLAPGCTGLKLLIRNFYEDKNVLFECRIDKIPVPGIDVGNYVFSDGSRTERDVAKGAEAAYDWGNLCVKGKVVKAAVGNGKSREWSAAAEKEGCRIALQDNICGWTKADDVTIFFDCVNNAYPLLGWYGRTEYAKEIEVLAKNYKSVTFYHIDAHTGAVGNELVDSIANIKLRESRYNGLGGEDSLTIDDCHMQKL